MKKILIKNAIIQENLYMLDNHYTADYDQMVDSIKGRIKFLNFNKFTLDKEKVTEEIGSEFFDNTIGKLEIEYTNLNTYENFDTILDSFYLSDLDGFRFKNIGDVSVLKAIDEHFGIDKFGWSVGNLIPKIKKKIELYYLLPDEDTDYYFELDEGEIEEI